MSEQEPVICERCNQPTHWLEVFPGNICLACYDAEHHNDPLTESDFTAMIAVWKGTD